jgi:CrcB protein
MGDPFLWGHFPWGTLAVNVIGSFLIGVLFQLFDQLIVSPDVKLLVLTGGLGAFTTFSTYSLDTFNLIQDGKIGLGLFNLAVSTLAGIIAVFLGIYVIRFLSNLGSS